MAPGNAAGVEKDAASCLLHGFGASSPANRDQKKLRIESLQRAVLAAYRKRFPRGSFDIKVNPLPPNRDIFRVTMVEKKSSRLVPAYLDFEAPRGGVLDEPKVFIPEDLRQMGVYRLLLAKVLQLHPIKSIHSVLDNDGFGIGVSRMGLSLDDWLKVPSGLDTASALNLRNQALDFYRKGSPDGGVHFDLGFQKLRSIFIKKGRAEVWVEEGAASADHDIRVQMSLIDAGGRVGLYELEASGKMKKLNKSEAISASEKESTDLDP